MICVFIISLAQACTPQPNLVCTREYAPVCADGNEYSNSCMARAAGFDGDCANRIVSGPCHTRNNPELPTGLNCGSNEVFSETGKCVNKPWSDFVSCAEEARQGACADGRDPNPWVSEHCVLTCNH